MSSNQFDKVRLFNELQQWTLEDLKTLCFYLELDQPKLALSYDKLAGATSREKAQALIRHLQKYERFQSWAHLRNTIEKHFTFMDATFLPKLAPTPMFITLTIVKWLRQIPVWGWAGGGVLVFVALLLVWQWSSLLSSLVTDLNVPPPNAQLGDEWVRPKDGMVMVFVPAPRQPFKLGSGLDAPTEGYWIDKYEVSNAQYELCVTARACEPSDYADDADFNGAEYPVVGISWDDAVAYAEWVGAELPTEEQWEYAAGGEDGRIYPWGNEFDGTRLNCYATDCPNDGYEYTAPVGNYPEGASWVGALDMAGNVWEWTSSPYDDSLFVMRGGSWDDYRSLALVSVRGGSPPPNWNDFLGVRLVRVPYFSGS